MRTEASSARADARRAYADSARLDTLTEGLRVLTASVNDLMAKVDSVVDSRGSPPEHSSASPSAPPRTGFRLPEFGSTTPPSPTTFGAAGGSGPAADAGAVAGAGAEDRPTHATTQRSLPPSSTRGGYAFAPADILRMGKTAPTTPKLHLESSYGDFLSWHTQFVIWINS